MKNHETQSPKINTKNVKTPRKDIPDNPLAVMEYMRQKGWCASIDFGEKQTGFVCFKRKEQWHDRAILAARCKYGYPFDNQNESAFRETTRRSAELCLQIYERFTTLVPGTPNIHGEITSCPFTNKAEYLELTCEAFVEKHKDKQLRCRTRASWSPQDSFFTLYGNTVTISDADRPALLSSIEQLHLKLDGTFAIDR